jgi:hypothetical protein
MASLASRCTSNTTAFFMGKQLARHWTRGQRSRIAVTAPLNYEFAMYRAKMEPIGFKDGPDRPVVPTIGDMQGTAPLVS